MLRIMLSSKPREKKSRKQQRANRIIEPSRHVGLRAQTRALLLPHTAGDSRQELDTCPKGHRGLSGLGRQWRCAAGSTLCNRIGIGCTPSRADSGHGCGEHSVQHNFGRMHSPPWHTTYNW
uniref:Uncharacterized protein n=1 Tax=Junco hyemalis TaxID=40217 RepID=A0A8C5NS08_JUNHY